MGREFNLLLIASGVWVGKGGHSSIAATGENNRRSATYPYMSGEVLIGKSVGFLVLGIGGFSMFGLGQGIALFSPCSAIPGV